MTKYEQEKEKAILFFSDPANFANDEKRTKKKNIKFHVYKDNGLVELLGTYFGSKCAYCESDFGAVTPSDIEHFRPKSAIKTKNGELKPGYYWLAGDWPNLLISCPDCNRSRTHEVPGQIEGTVLGKGTQFPLVDESVRVRDHKVLIGGEDAARLLLDPCTDDPEEHLEFDANGNVRARVHDNTASKMGAVSIDVYALRRKALVEAREAALLDLQFVFEDLNGLVLLNNGMREEGVAANLLQINAEQIERSMRKLIRMFLKNSEYLAAKRDWMRTADTDNSFAVLRAFGIEPMELVS